MKRIIFDKVYLKDLTLSKYLLEYIPERQLAPCTFCYSFPLSVLALSKTLDNDLLNVKDREGYKTMCIVALVHVLLTCSKEYGLLRTMFSVNTIG